MNNDLLWNKFLENIQSNVNSMVYATWFSKTKLLSIEEKKITLIVPLEIHRKRIQETYHDLIVNVFNKITGK